MTEPDFRALFESAPGFDPRPEGSLGLKLVDALVEQLQGRLEIRSGRGARFTVRFPPTSS